MLFPVGFLSGATAVEFVLAFGTAFEVGGCRAIGAFWRGSGGHHDGLEVFGGLVWLLGRWELLHICG